MPVRPAPLSTRAPHLWATAALVTLCVLHEHALAQARIPPPPSAPGVGIAAKDDAARFSALPGPVKDTRQRILGLAQTGQYEALEALALGSGIHFVFHQGFERAKPARYWRAEAARGHDPLKRLITLLRMNPAQDQGLYVWPAAAVAATPAALEALRVLYVPSRIQRYASEGYSGWRTGIDDQGRWRLFLRGN